MLEHILVLVGRAIDHFLDFVTDGEQRVAETVELFERFAFRGFDHQRARDREGDGWRMVAVIHQAFGHILHFDAVRFERTEIQDELMCATSAFGGIQHGIRRFEARFHVVRIQNGEFRGFTQSIGAHQADVGVADRENACGAPRRGRDRRDAVLTAHRNDRVTRQERCQVFCDADRTHARATAAVRNAEGLVQIQVADIGADIGGGGESHLRVHVRPIHVHLPAATMNNLTNLADFFLEHAVRRRVRHHQATQPIRVLVGFGSQIGQVDVAAFVAFRDHDLHPGHHSRRRVGSMGRAGNQRHVAMRIATVLVPSANRHQAGVFTLCAGIRLHRHGVEAGHFAQPRFQVGNHLLVAFGLVGRRERMDVAELGPGHRNHLGGGIQFHGARAQRDHRMSEGKVFVLHALQVTQHFMLAVMRVEYRMRHEVAGAFHILGQIGLDVGGAERRFVELGLR